MSIVPGQRYASATEHDLGLGIAIEVEGRRVTVLFPAAEERRVYAIDTSPLNRIRYTPGDRVQDVNERTLRIGEVIEKDGLMIYRCSDENGEPVVLPEMDLSAFAQFTTPVQRLTTAQVDPVAAYRLRQQAVLHTDKLQRSRARGLIGPRVSLLPHQLHIADTVANRFAPRVLLADEVGLGKTIEAGMIVHHQLETGRARRVLILVPDSLVYQWLVEMLRRFNLSFALFDLDRFEALREEGIDNPFEAEQRVLCSLSLLADNPQLQAAAVAANWDLLIVDEAHHLVWSQGQDEDLSPEQLSYQCVEQLAQVCAGLLLLTATPEQLGMQSHFARLRLLDPARFYDLATFTAEQEQFQELNQHIAPLLEPDHALSDAECAVFSNYVARPVASDLTPTQRRELLRELLDRHGTGRVLFRNTRAAVPDFPTRKVQTFELPCPEIYATPPANLEEALYPESVFADDDTSWLRNDPRVSWLVETLKKKRAQKMLVICHRMATAKALDEHLTLREGLRSTSFYEGLSLLERDRAAAYFAEGQDDGGGAQVLVCSEIGSEGRNFQFAHHLVLFDVPLIPDLLEQRIGRLDRIGQSETIQIHVPYIAHTAGHRLLRWQHEGLNALASSVRGAQSVYGEFRDALHGCLLDADEKALDKLIAATQQRATAVTDTLRKGRDRLIELNSCDADNAASVIQALEEHEADPLLPEFLSATFDHYGVDQEDESEHTIILRPSERLTGHFPGLTDDGLTATFDRDTALAREDMHYMTWEHPIAKEALAMTVQSDVGNAALNTISLRALPKGTLLLEAWFTIAVVAPAHLQIERYLSLTPTRVLMTANGKDVSVTLDAPRLDALCKDVDRKTARAVLKQVREPLGEMIEHAKAAAETQRATLTTQAGERMQSALGAERDRLTALAVLNPNVRADEIEHLGDVIEQSARHIERAQMRLDALRLIVNT